MLYSSKRNIKKRNDNSFIIMLVIVIIMTAGFKSQNWEKRLIIEVVILAIYFIAIAVKKSGVCDYFIKTKFTDASSGLNAIDTMSGEEFELLLAEHFRKKGYLVKTTAKSHDYGADLILTKKGKRTVVQVKRYKSKIGIEAIQQAYASMPYYKTDKCMVITNSYFTPSAIKLAERNNVILWNRDVLVRKFDIKK